MSIGVNIDGVNKNPVSIFAGINGEKKRIKKVYAEKDGLPLLVYPSRLNINNRFYLVTNNGIIYSDDGIDWKELKTNGLPESISNYTFAYGNGVYILFHTSNRNNSQGYYRSTDLMNWEHYESLFNDYTGTMMSSITSSNCCFTYIGNRFIAITIFSYYQNKKVYNVSKFKYSFDGISWNDMSGLSSYYKVPSSVDTTAVTLNYAYSDFNYLDGIYVCKAHCRTGLNSSSYYQIIYYSNDGVAWKSSASYTSSTLSTYQHYGLNTIYCLNNLFIRKYYDPTDKKSFLYYSSDGKTWTQATLPSAMSGSSLGSPSYAFEYINGKFVVPIFKSGIGTNFYCSKDLNNWESESMGYIPIYNASSSKFISNNNILIAWISINSTYYYDEVNNLWNKFDITEYTDIDTYIDGIEYCNGVFFFRARTSPFILYSLSGLNFFPCNIVSDNEISINSTKNNIFYVDNNGCIREG